LLGLDHMLYERRCGTTETNTTNTARHV
jgi:hypothetical protein